VPPQTGAASFRGSSALTSFQGQTDGCPGDETGSLFRTIRAKGPRELARFVPASNVDRDDVALRTTAHLVSSAGLCPRHDESAGKRPSTRLRQGAPWLKTAMVQAAWASARAKTGYFPAQFLRLRSRRGPRKAVVAVAASMLTAAY
jgi:transposase